MSEVKQKKTKKTATEQQPKEEKSEKKTLTKTTQAANLNMNVNGFKRWLAKYCEMNDHFVESKVKSEEKKEDTKPHVPKFHGVHIALTAAAEIMCTYILKETISQLQKDVAGMYNITRPAIAYAITLNKDLDYIYCRHMQKFDKDMIYCDQFCVSHKEMIDYIDKIYTKNLVLDNKAYNMLAFLLQTFMNVVAHHIVNMMYYAKKTTLNYDVVLYAIKNICSGTLVHDMTLRIEDARSLLLLEKEEEDEEIKTNEDGTKEEVKAEVKEGAKEEDKKEEVKAEVKEVAKDDGGKKKKKKKDDVEVKVEVKPEVKVEVEPEVKVETKPEVKVDTKKKSVPVEEESEEEESEEEESDEEPPKGQTKKEHKVATSK